MGNVKIEEAPKDFDEWRNMIEKDYEPARYWYDSIFQTECMGPRMEPVAMAANGDHGDKKGMDMDMGKNMEELKHLLEENGVDVEMRDNGVTLSMEGVTIEMEEGENGNSMRIVMGAANLSASALALATAALY